MDPVKLGWRRDWRGLILLSAAATAYAMLATAGVYGGPLLRRYVFTGLGPDDTAGTGHYHPVISVLDGAVVLIVVGVVLVLTAGVVYGMCALAWFLWPRRVEPAEEGPR